MNQEIKQRWVEALRSGEYKQGTSYLRYGNEYCCLGCLCDLYAKDHNIQWEESINGAYEIFKIKKILPVKVVEWAGLLETDPYVYFEGRECTLAGFNDCGISFDSLSDIIEKQL